MHLYAQSPTCCAGSVERMPMAFFLLAVGKPTACNMSSYAFTKAKADSECPSTSAFADVARGKPLAGEKDCVQSFYNAKRCKESPEGAPSM